MQASDIWNKLTAHRLNPSFWTQIKLWKLGWVVSFTFWLLDPWERNLCCPLNRRIVGNWNPYAASETRKISYAAHGPVTKPTYLLTPWSRVLLQKQIGFQPVKKCPAFYGTTGFITALTSAHRLSLSWASPTQSTHHPTSWRSIIILSSHLCVGLPSGLTKPTYTHKLQGLSQRCLSITVFFAGHLVICDCKTQCCMFPSQDDSSGSKHVKVLNGVNKTHYLCYAIMNECYWIYSSTMVWKLKFGGV
jgi:hypothetical protein